MWVIGKKNVFIFSTVVNINFTDILVIVVRLKKIQYINVRYLLIIVIAS